MVYAHGQKNVGIAGSTVVVLRNSSIDSKKEKDTPYLNDYEVYRDTNGFPNTPPIFPIYVNYLCF
jgi:phosphoserine aminotransferase